MEIIKQNCKCKCDINNCRKSADYYITDEGVMPMRRINICADCMAELYREFGKIIKPFACDNRNVKENYGKPNYYRL